MTAGIFLIIRCSFIFEYAPITLNFILILGGLTAIFGSTIACCQNDIKRIIAFSTTSQLGYMFFACGLSGYPVALFHLINHGFFKALLFLCAGTVIFLMSHEQDIRKYGRLIVISPFIYSAFLIGNFALMGFPFLSGFYSKEVIIEAAFVTYNINSYFIYWVSTIAASLTAWYSMRSVFLGFLSQGNWEKVSIQNIPFLKESFIVSIWVLILGSCLSGFIYFPVLIGMGSSFLAESIYISTSNLMIDFEYLSTFIKNMPLIGSFLGGCMAFSFNFFFFFKLNQISIYQIKTQYMYFLFSEFIYYTLQIRTFLSQKWYLDFLGINYFGFFFLKHGYETYYKLLDKGFLEIFFFNGFSLTILRLSNKILLQHNGFLYSLFCLNLLCFLFFCFLLFLF